MQQFTFSSYFHTHPTWHFLMTFSKLFSVLIFFFLMSGLILKANSFFLESSALTSNQTELNKKLTDNAKLETAANRLKTWWPVLTPQYKKKQDKFEQACNRVSRVASELEHLWEEAEEAGCVHPGELMAPGDLTAAFPYLQRSYREDRRLFSEIHSAKTRNNCHKSKKGFHWNIRRKKI